MKKQVVATLLNTCCLWAADLVVAAAPRTLEEALVGYTWEWTHAPKPPDQLTFTADGIAVCHRFSWKWKISGPRTVEAFDAWSEGKTSPNFQAQLTFDSTFSTLEGEAGGGKWRFTGRRLVVTSSDEQALRDAVCGARWTWIVDQPHPDPWDERRFEPSGRAIASRRGEVCTGQWEITGPRTVRIQNIPPSVTFTFYHSAEI